MHVTTRAPRAVSAIAAPVPGALAATPAPAAPPSLSVSLGTVSDTAYHQVATAVRGSMP
ncbi:hypothetical protein [Catenulispora subtropica]|uniref:Uncharacterized protein n=1 Tax=Catenulispora subtropica TaxID=450798 RepID=A0ABN2RUT2_9ACTN